jgi:hypothetical protein
MGAYKQFLTSDVIVAPLEVNKDFTFKGNELTGSNVGISKLTGRNVTNFDFDPDIDPITGIYTVVTPGTTSSVSLSITPFHNEAASIGSSSFVVNGVNITLTGSSGGNNLTNTIYIPSGSNSTNSTINIRNHINNSSSFYFGLINITASNSTTTLRLSSKNTGYINNSYFITSASVLSFFTGGTNDVVTGDPQYQRLVYESIKHLYYSNYLSSSYSGPVNRQILVPGRDTKGDRYIGSASSQGHYDNYLQTTLQYPRFFPTASDSLISVISIPAALFGDYIQPNSFQLIVSGGGTYVDDGQGNIITGSDIVGNIIYTHGIAVLTGNQGIYEEINVVSPLSSTYGSAIYGTGIYGTLENWNLTLNNLINSNNITCSFSSSYLIYETQYKCTIRENEFNFTLNPSTISGSYDTGSTAGSVYGYITESYFSPYITTVGLYDEQQNLLAIGKLAQPLPSSPTTDTTILINIDR